MKKLVRVICVIFVSALICMIFTGCDAVDELKDKHAVFSEDKETVTFQGETFIKLPEGVPYYFDNVYSNSCVVTEADVPVLLSDLLGYHSYCDSLRGLIAVPEFAFEDNSFSESFMTPAFYPYGDSHIFYCQEDRFSEYSALTSEDADSIGFSTFYRESEMGLFSIETSKEIFGCIDNGLTDVDNYADIIEDSRLVIQIYRCNKELTLCGKLSGYELHIMPTRDVYLVNYITADSAKLSDEAVEDILTEYYDFTA